MSLDSFISFTSKWERERCILSPAHTRGSPRRWKESFDSYHFCLFWFLSHFLSSSSLRSDTHTHGTQTRVVTAHTHTHTNGTKKQNTDENVLFRNKNRKIVLMMMVFFSSSSSCQKRGAEILNFDPPLWHPESGRTGEYAGKKKKQKNLLKIWFFNYFGIWNFEQENQIPQFIKICFFFVCMFVFLLRGYLSDNYLPVHRWGTNFEADDWLMMADEWRLARSWRDFSWCFGREETKKNICGVVDDVMFW